MSEPLTMSRVWLAECGRCANEEASSEDRHDEALRDLANRGWADDMCPDCNRDIKPPSTVADVFGDIYDRLSTLEAAQEPHNRHKSDSGGLDDQLHTHDDEEGA